jgi:hypothetical protein
MAVGAERSGAPTHAVHADRNTIVAINANRGDLLADVDMANGDLETRTTINLVISMFMHVVCEFIVSGCQTLSSLMISITQPPCRIITLMSVLSGVSK